MKNDTQSERELFEQWAEHTEDYNLSKLMDSDVYLDSWTEGAWLGWQAARAQAMPAITELERIILKEPDRYKGGDDFAPFEAMHRKLDRQRAETEDGKWYTSANYLTQAAINAWLPVIVKRIRALPATPPASAVMGEDELANALFGMRYSHGCWCERPIKGEELHSRSCVAANKALTKATAKGEV